MAEEELIKISASAMMNIVLHAFRFWSNEPTGKHEIVYGALVGYIEGNTRHIKKIVPILHYKNNDYEMGDEFMKIIGTINKSELESGSMNEVLGWYRSSKRGIKFEARDIKNHIQFQDFNSKFIALILSPELYLDPDEYGFSVFRLQGEQYYNMMTDYYRIPWEIQTVEDISGIISNFKIYIENYFLDQPLISEYQE